MTYPLPTNETLVDGIGMFTYINSIHIGLLPFFIFALWMGFIMLMVSKGNRFDHALFSSSFVVTFFVGLLFFGGVLNGFVPIVSVVITALSLGMLVWNKEQ